MHQHLEHLVHVVQHVTTARPADWWWPCVRKLLALVGK